MSRKVVGAWLVLNVAVLVLYTCVPPLLFNDGAGRIAGMPEMLFWFTVLPILVPAVMAALYVYDSRLMARYVPMRDGESR
jgi:uncharacterized membrane protein